MARYRFGMYRSVMLPSAISAAKNTVSDKRRMRVDGEPDVLRVGAHLQRQHRLGDQLAGVQADDGGAQQPVRALVEQQLGDAFVARRSRARGRSRPTGTPPSRSRGPAPSPGFGQAHPCDFRIGVGDRRNGARVERDLVSGDDLRGELAFVRRLVRQHRLADDVADGVDVRHVGAHLLVHRDEAALVDLHAGGFGVDRLAVRAASHRHQDAVVDLRRRRAFAFEGDLKPFWQRLDFGDLGLQQDRFVALLDALVQRPDDVAVGARNQPVQQLDHA